SPPLRAKPGPSGLGWRKPTVYSSFFVPGGPIRPGPCCRRSCPVVKLRVRSGESIQDAVRRFRKLCERSGLRKEMRRKAYYEKPSERRRREELKRLRKARQATRV